MNMLTPFDTWVSEPIKVPIPGDTWSPTNSTTLGGDKSL